MSNKSAPRCHATPGAAESGLWGALRCVATRLLDYHIVDNNFDYKIEGNHL
jgi:hypothetical protein